MLCQNSILERHARGECSLVVKFLLQSSPELLNRVHPLVEVAHATRRVEVLDAVLSHTTQVPFRRCLVVPALGLDVVNLHILVVNLAAAIGAMPVVLRIDRVADKTVTNFHCVRRIVLIGQGHKCRYNAEPF